MNETHLFVFAIVVVTGDKTKTEKRKVLNGMVGRIEMSRNWFRSAITANVIKVLTDAITEATTRFANVELVAQFALYAVKDIGRKNCTFDSVFKFKDNRNKC